MQTLADAITEIDALKTALFGLTTTMLGTGLLDPSKLDGSLTAYAAGNPNPPTAGSHPSLFLQSLLNLSN